MLAGAAEQSDEVLQVDSAAYIDLSLADSDTGQGTDQHLYFFLSVTSLTLGAVDQLRGKHPGEGCLLSRSWWCLGEPRP